MSCGGVQDFYAESGFGDHLTPNFGTNLGQCNVVGVEVALDAVEGGLEVGPDPPSIHEADATFPEVGGQLVEGLRNLAQNAEESFLLGVVEMLGGGVEEL
jgi:hypothetical protein